MKTKTFFSIILAIIIAFGAAPVVYAEGSENIKEITSQTLSTNSYVASDFGNGELFTVSFDYNADANKYTLSVFDVNTAELKKHKTYKNRNIPVDSIDECEVKDDGTYVIYDYFNGVTAVYNSDLTLKEKGTCEKNDGYDSLGAENKLIGTSFSKNRGYARCNDENDFSKPVYAMAFYDDDTCAYLTEDSEIDCIYDSYSHRVLSTVKGKPGKCASAYIYDYAEKKRYSAETRSFSGYTYNGIIYGELDGDYAFFVVESDAGNECYNTPFIWNYSAETESTSFGVTKLTQKSVKAMNKSLITELSDSYGINILVDKAPDTWPTYWDETTGTEYGGVIRGANVFDTYIILNCLKGYLGWFPKGFVKEMKHFGGKDHPFDIYIDKEIEGAAAAFANRYDGFLICFATDEFSHDFIPHEFLHLIDARIDDWLTSQNRNYELEWGRLNPKSFFYYDGQDFMPKYFPSVYAMTDSREDRADTFEYLFEAYNYPAQPFIYNALKKKSIFLTELIRAAYPSVRKTAFTTWERWITPYPTEFKAKKTENSLKLTWSECRSAEKYELAQYKGGKWISLSDGAKRSFKLEKLKSGKPFEFRVRAVRTYSGKKVYSSWEYLYTATKPAAPTKLKLKTNSKHRIIASWKKAPRCTGYQVQYAKDKAFKKIIATRTVSKKYRSYTGKNFTKGRKYYVRVRAYTESGSKKIYSKWSAVKSIKSK
ncbi:MAG: fibronectin type III domain-containing protein [Eubacterium sp.]|nr:fibronectin type III domain-containing protein [Eubacterium sp.]